MEDTRACLQTLQAQRGGFDLEILVVDNASEDATPRLDREFPGVRVLRQPRNLGFAGGVNQGLAHATGELFLVLNNDTLAAEDLLERLLAALRGDERLGMVAPVSNHVKGPQRVAVGDRGLDARGRAAVAAELARSCGGIVEDASTLAGLCWLLPRDTWQRLGPLDDRFGIGNYEDDDYCLRARLAGMRLGIVRDAFLHHHGHRTFRALGVDYGQVLAERGRIFAAKWQDDPAARALAAEQAGELLAAEHWARLGLGRHPAWVDGPLLLANAAALRGDVAAARAHLRHFRAACPNLPRALALEARLRLEAREFEAAEAALAELFVRTHPEPGLAAATLAHFARVHLDAGRLEDAERHVSWLRELDPGRADAANLQGALHLARGAFAAAADSFAAAHRGGDPDALTNLGIALWRLGRTAEALQAATRAAARAAAPGPARANLGAMADALERAGHAVPEPVRRALAR